MSNQLYHPIRDLQETNLTIQPITSEEHFLEERSSAIFSSSPSLSSSQSSSLSSSTTSLTSPSLTRHSLHQDEYKHMKSVGQTINSLSGVRTLSALVVIFHHISALDSSMSEGRTQRSLQAMIDSSNQNLWEWLLLVGAGPGSVVKNSFSQGLPSIFASQLSGSLWILEALFFAPFISLALQLPILGAAKKVRSLWYIGCLVYLIGNGYNPRTISAYFPVLVGVIFADLYSNGFSLNVQQQSKNNNALVYSHNHSGIDILPKVYRYSILFLSVFFLCMPWFSSPFYAHSFSLVMCACAFVFLALFWEPVRASMDNGFFSRGAKYTYSLYIWHLLVLNTFGASVVPYFNTFLGKVFAYVAAYLATFLVTYVAYIYIEAPINRVIDSQMENILVNDDLRKMKNAEEVRSQKQNIVMNL
eukprot:Awhi_evm1s15083